MFQYSDAYRPTNEIYFFEELLIILQIHKYVHKFYLAKNDNKPESFIHKALVSFCFCET